VLVGSCNGVAFADADDDEQIAVVRSPGDQALASVDDAASLAALALWAARR